jgi:Domain of unknown function (DUF4062)
MIEKKYQVFVSSTYEDLQRERKRIFTTLAEGGYIAAGMELFPAIDEEQFKYIKGILDESDYCVCVVAGKYGSLAPDGIGYSEKEYDYAVEQHIPVIALIKRDIRTLSPNKLEVDPRKFELLDEFRKRLSSGRLAKFWDEESDLCLQMVGSLAVTAKKYPRDGWIRGRHDPEVLLRKIVDLEETNRTLEGELAAQREMPIVERIKKRLAGQTLEMNYYLTKPSDASVDAGRTAEQMVEKVSLYKVAEYMLPRLKLQTSPEEFSELTKEALTFLTLRKIAEVNPKDVDEIKRILDESGLINLTSRTLGEHLQIMIVVTHLGLEVAKDENSKLKALEKLREPSRSPNYYRPITFGHVLGEMLDFFIAEIANGVRWLARKLSSAKSSSNIKASDQNQKDV